VVWLKRKASRYVEQYPLDRPEQRFPPSITSVVSLYPLLFSIVTTSHCSLRDVGKIRLAQKKGTASTLYRYTCAIDTSGRVHPTGCIDCEVVNRVSAG
jgi:hypothetical protein